MVGVVAVKVTCGGISNEGWAQIFRSEQLLAAFACLCLKSVELRAH